MPTVKRITEEEATGRVQEICDGIRRTYGIPFVPNADRTMAVYPEFLEAQWGKIETLRIGQEFSAWEKELLALAVSATNGCDYCIDVHAAILKRMGASDRAIVEAMAVVNHYSAIHALLDGRRIECDIKE